MSTSEYIVRTLADPIIYKFWCCTGVLDRYCSFVWSLRFLWMLLRLCTATGTAPALFGSRLNTTGCERLRAFHQVGPYIQGFVSNRQKKGADLKNASRVSKECSKRSENIINRKAVNFYIEAIPQIFSQLRKILFFFESQKKN